MQACQTDCQGIHRDHHHHHHPLYPSAQCPVVYRRSEAGREETKGMGTGGGKSANWSFGSYSLISTTLNVAAAYLTNRCRVGVRQKPGPKPISCWLVQVAGPPVPRSHTTTTTAAAAQRAQRLLIIIRREERIKIIHPPIFRCGRRGSLEKNPGPFFSPLSGSPPDDPIHPIIIFCYFLLMRRS